MAKPGTGTGKAPNDPTASPSLRSPARGVVSLKIAILGTRGVPPRYGGFETFAAELGTRLVARGHEVTVYCRDGGEGTVWLSIRRIVLPAIRHKYLETVSHTFLFALK